MNFNVLFSVPAITRDIVNNYLFNEIQQHFTCEFGNFPALSCQRQKAFDVFMFTSLARQSRFEGFYLRSAILVCLSQSISMVHCAWNRAYLLGSDSYIYAADENGNIVDSASYGVQSTDIALDERRQLLYVAAESNQSIYVIEPGNLGGLVDSLTTPDGPFGVAVNPNNGSVYYTSRITNVVGRIDTQTEEKYEVGAGVDPMHLAVNPVTGKVYVPERSGGTVSVFDETLDLLSRVTVGGQPTHTAVNPVTNRAYAVTGSGQTLAVIDGNSDEVIENINLDADTLALAMDSERNLIYVFAQGAEGYEIFRIDGITNTVEERFPAGTGGTDFFALALLVTPCGAVSTETPFNLLSAIYSATLGATGPIYFNEVQLSVNPKVIHPSIGLFEVQEDGIYEINYHLSPYGTGAIATIFYVYLNGSQINESYSGAVNGGSSLIPITCGTMIYERLSAGDTLYLALAAGGPVSISWPYISFRKVSD